MAFHPLPQIIPYLFNGSGFDPPVNVTSPSICSWQDHPVSGLMLQTIRPIQTRFPCAYTYRLKLACNTKSLTHYTKGTPSGPIAPPTACKHSVSGTVSLPSRGAFHLSLAVLVRYRSQESIQGWRVDPPDSHRVSRARRYSGADCRGDPIRVRGSNPVPPAFPGRSASVRLCNRTIVGPTTPGGTCPPRFALGPLSLATTRGISI